ncbi:MAG: type II toxin-antitoxin system Phd/YefM family antitoxin [Zoogloeaceae bacterium]|nr:type II toxin-antitoxin system Phd/YefM family antitoxin [Zoogloeaceae bacterium]
MQAVNMFQAKSSLSRLVEAIEQGREREIVIARNGHPVARLVPMDTAQVGQRIGVARGKFKMPDTIDTHNEEVARQFMGGNDKGGNAKALNSCLRRNDGMGTAFIIF